LKKATSLLLEMVQPLAELSNPPLTTVSGSDPRQSHRSEPLQRMPDRRLHRDRDGQLSRDRIAIPSMTV